MFQFRPFPSYAYLIQRRITRYCRVGFPHSEICGFSGYLLLPAAYRSLSRPSSAPDAKAFPLRSFQLDRRRVKLRSLRFRLAAKTAYRSVAPPLSSHKRFAGLREEGTGVTMRANYAHFVSAWRRKLRIAPLPLLFLAQTLRWFVRGGETVVTALRAPLSRRVIRDFGSLKNYAGNFKNGNRF